MEETGCGCKSPRIERQGGGGIQHVLPRYIRRSDQPSTRQRFNVSTFDVRTVDASITLDIPLARSVSPYKMAYIQRARMRSVSSHKRVGDFNVGAVRQRSFGVRVRVI